MVRSGSQLVVVLFLLGISACTGETDPDLGLDGGGGGESDGGMPGRGLTPIHAGAFAFTSLRAADGTFFISARDSAASEVQMLRARPGQPATVDGPLQGSGATLSDQGVLGGAGDGSVLSLWGELVGGDARIQARRFDPVAKQWDAAETVSNDPGVTSSFFFANVATSGDALVVWDEGTNVWAVEQRAGGAWSAPQQLDPPDTGPPSYETHYAYGAAFAGARSGRGLATWNESGVGLQAAFYAPGQGWSATPVPAVSLSNSDPRAVALNDAGQAAFLWESSGTLHSLHFDGSGWGADTVVDTDVGDFKLTLFGGGDAVAVWANTATDPATLKLGHFNGSSWDVVSRGEMTGSFDLAPVPGGDALALFTALDLTTLRYHLQSVRFSASAGFSEVAPVAPAWTDLPFHLRTHLAADGTAYALWSEISLAENKGLLYLEPIGAGAP